MHSLYKILRELDNARIHYTLARYRPDTVLIQITLPGERIEIDIFDDGRIETCFFKGSETPEDGMDVVKRIIDKCKE